jgi:hypothetical protein
MQKCIVRLLEIDFKNENYEIKITINVECLQPLKAKETVQVNDKYSKKTGKCLRKPAVKTVQKYFVTLNLTSDISATESRVSTP